MKVLKGILIFVVVLVVLLVVVGLFLPDKAHVERSTTINAPQSTVFALANGFNMFNKWSPWADIDPDTEYSYAGPAFGVGAKMTWSSENRNVGKGSSEIIESTPYEMVKNRLDFGDQGQATAFYKLEAENDGTKVTWGFDTEFGYNLIGRYFGLFFDGMIGKDYEKGLAQLKSLAESLPKADFAGLEAEILETEPIAIAYVSTQSSRDNAEIEGAIGAAYGKVAQFIGQHGLTQAGAPITINTSINDSGYVFDAALPIQGEPSAEIAPDSEVKLGQTFAGKALRFVHKGPYEGLPVTYEKILAYIAAHGYEVTDRSWDQFVNDPGSTPPEELETHIFFPIK